MSVPVTSDTGHISKGVRRDFIGPFVVGGGKTQIKKITRRNPYPSLCIDDKVHCRHSMSITTVTLQGSMFLNTKIKVKC